MRLFQEELLKKVGRPNGCMSAGHLYDEGMLHAAQAMKLFCTKASLAC